MEPSRDVIACILADHFCDEFDWEKLPERNRDFYRAIADEILKAIGGDDGA